MQSVNQRQAEVAALLECVHNLRIGDTRGYITWKPAGNAAYVNICADSVEKRSECIDFDERCYDCDIPNSTAE